MKREDMLDAADRIMSRATHMHSLPPGEPSFTMYSYGRPANMFWVAVTAEFLRRGMSPEDVETTLQAKVMRIVLDRWHEEFEIMAVSFVDAVEAES